MSFISKYIAWVRTEFLETDGYLSHNIDVAFVLFRCYSNHSGNVHEIEVSSFLRCDVEALFPFEMSITLQLCKYPHKPFSQIL
jgi:hypothetical protein